MFTDSLAEVTSLANHGTRGVVPQTTSKMTSRKHDLLSLALQILNACTSRVCAVEGIDTLGIVAPLWMEGWAR